MKPPKLKKIDLKRRHESIAGKMNPDRAGHPDITENKEYLAKINGTWYAGRFTMQWYGWNFGEVYDAGYQLWYDGLSPDKDGWEELYEIVETEE